MFQNNFPCLLIVNRNSSDRREIIQDRKDCVFELSLVIRIVMNVNQIRGKGLWANDELSLELFEPNSL